MKLMDLKLTASYRYISVNTNTRVCFTRSIILLINKLTARKLLTELTKIYDNFFPPPQSSASNRIII